MDAIPLWLRSRWKTLPMRFWQNASPRALELDRLIDELYGFARAPSSRHSCRRTACGRGLGDTALGQEPTLKKQSPHSQLNPFNLADRDLVLGPVVELGGPGRLMSRHLLGMLEPTTVLQVDRHTGRAPGMAANRRQKAGVPGSFADCCPGVIPIQRAAAKRGACLMD